MAIILANTKYTYSTDDQQSCGWEAEIFRADIGLSDIHSYMLENVNKYIYGDENYIAMFEGHKWNTEHYQYFSIYEYREGYSDDDYYKKWNQKGFWFIFLRII